jgi:GNAT superfamily N-acetyltransferase
VLPACHAGIVDANAATTSSNATTIAALVERATEWARALKYKQLYLESHRSMEAAHHIYEAAGFRRVEAPPAYPEYIRAVAVCMRLELLR